MKSRNIGGNIMACFLVPAAEAVVVTAVAYGIKAKEKKSPTLNDTTTGKASDAFEDVKIAVSTKLMWLANLLWGGCLLLCYEHIWHGEVVPWFPFLTAMSSPDETSVMLSEMRSVGGTMALEITAVWVIIVLIANAIVKRKAPTSAAA